MVRIHLGKRLRLRRDQGFRAIERGSESGRFEVSGPREPAVQMR